MEDYAKTILDLNENKAKRIRAAFKLENMGTDESVRILGKSLETDPSPIVRHEAAFALGETANPKVAGPFLMKAVENDKDVFVRHESLLALATLGDESFKPFIKKYLKDPDKHISESAEIALERFDLVDKGYG